MRLPELPGVATVLAGRSEFVIRPEISRVRRVPDLENLRILAWIFRGFRGKTGRVVAG